MKSISYLFEIDRTTKYLKKLTKNKDIRGIRDFMHRTSGQASDFHSRNPEMALGRLAYQYPTDIDIKDLAKIAKGTYRASKPTHERLTPTPIKNKNIEDLKFWNRIKKEKEHNLNNPEYKYSNNKMIKFIHSGGRKFIDKFLTGKSKGYNLEDGGKGIQIHDGDDIELGNDRSEFYSNTAAFRRFDDPAYITGEIRADKIRKAPNSYEGGIDYRDLKYAKNIKVNDIPFDDKYKSLISPLDYDKFSKKYKLSKDTIEKLNNAY